MAGFGQKDPAGDLAIVHVFSCSTQGEHKISEEHTLDLVAVRLEY